MPRKKRDICSIVIEWSPEDQAYVVVLPEWADQYAMPVAHGSTYEEAAERGRNALENDVRFAQEDGRPLPPPRVFCRCVSCPAMIQRHEPAYPA